MLETYISDFPQFLNPDGLLPWELIADLDAIIDRCLPLLGSDYEVNNGVAIHKTAIIEQGVTIKGRIIIMENCFIGAHAYLRGPLVFGNSVKVGPGCEIKQSVILDHSATAHFNYVGNSIVGKQVNFEAGSVAANHYNEREEKEIIVLHDSKLIRTKVEKFGSLIGDNCKIGANAVLSPGTMLKPGAIVKRLELVDQVNS